MVLGVHYGEGAARRRRDQLACLMYSTVTPLAGSGTVVDVVVVVGPEGLVVLVGFIGVATILPLLEAADVF